jgi:iron(III) transport system permease protein
MWRAQPARTAVIGAALVIFVVCTCAPVAYLLFTSLGESQGAYAIVLLDARQRVLMFNTALLGVGSALFATAVGVPLGTALARVPFRRKALIRLVLAAPALIPPYVVGLAWVYLGSSRGILQALIGHDLLSHWTYSLPGAILVLGLVFYPLSMLATEVTMRQIDSRLEEAALIDAPFHRVLRRITMPLAVPSILATALVIFVLALSEFGVPGLLRVRVYTTEVFTAFAALYDFTRATLLSLPLLVLSGAVTTVAAVLFGDRLVTTRRRTGGVPLELDTWRAHAQPAILAVVLVAVGLPTAILLSEAVGARSASAVFTGSGRAIANSLTLSTAGATVVLAVAVWLGYARARAGRRVGHVADTLLVVLFAVPGTIVGIGLIGLWNRPGFLGLVYATDAMFLLAYLARFLPVAVLILAASTRYVPVSHEEAAVVHGAGWFRTMMRIVLPQTRLGLATAWVITFVLAFGELGVSILVAPPGESTLPIRIYTIIANTPSSTVASLALLQTLVIFAPLGILAAAGSHREGR